MNRLFKIFGKLTSSKEINQNGVGLGLTISKRLTQEMGGEITVQSKFGDGATFSFTIKCEFPEESIYDPMDCNVVEDRQTSQFRK